MKTIQEHLTSVWKAAESDTETTDMARRQTERETQKERLAATVAPKTEGKPLVLLQVKCMSIYIKALDFWNLIDTCKPDVVIGTESWIHQEISNADVFSGDQTISRRDRHTRGGGVVFICVNNYTTCAEQWVDDVHEMTAVEAKGRDRKLHGKMQAHTELQTRTRGCQKNWQTRPGIWEELRSVASLELISTCLIRDWNGHAEGVGGLKYF